jgi:hypothetical protein
MAERRAALSAFYTCPSSTGQIAALGKDLVASLAPKVIALIEALDQGSSTTSACSSPKSCAVRGELALDG